jgi:hypothetical protein
MRGKRQRMRATQTAASARDDRNPAGKPPGHQAPPRGNALSCCLKRIDCRSLPDRLPFQEEIIFLLY